MRDSKEWVRQPMVDEAADAIVATGKYGVLDVTAYQISKVLGCEPNGALHLKVRDWRRRRQDEAASSPIDVPPEADTELGDALDRMTGEVKAVFVRTVQRVGSEFERSKTLRVVDAERRRDAAEAETDKVLELWQKTEADLADALLKVGELEQTAVEGRIREERLAGRLEQRNADWATALQQGLRDAPQTVPTDGADGISAGPDTDPITVTESVANESSGEATGDAD